MDHPCLCEGAGPRILPESCRMLSYGVECSPIFPAQVQLLRSCRAPPGGPGFLREVGSNGWGDVAGSPLAFKSQTSFPCVLARAATARDHRPHGLNSRNLFSHRSGGGESQREVRQGCFWCRPAFWLADGHLLAVSSQGGEREPQRALRHHSL